MPELTDFDDRRKYEITGVFRDVRRTFYRSDQEGAQELLDVLVKAGFRNVVMEPVK